MMTVEEEDEAEKRGYGLGLASLQFFCFPGVAQVDSWHRIAEQALPHFFPDQTEADRGCDYFMGVACVFKIYWGCVFDARTHSGSGELDALQEFQTRLGHYMFENDAREWSESAVLDEDHAMWKDLRVLAKLALNEIGEALPSEPPAFLIDELVNPYEFGGIGPTDSWDLMSSPEI